MRETKTESLAKAMTGTVHWVSILVRTGDTLSTVMSRGDTRTTASLATVTGYPLTIRGPQMVFYRRMKRSKRLLRGEILRRNLTRWMLHELVA